MIRMYLKRSGPCDGLAVVTTVAYAKKAMNQSCMDVITSRTCARGKVIGLSACCCHWHENRQISSSNY